MSAAGAARPAPAGQQDRIEQRFAALTASGRKALLSFITAGDPHPRETVALMHALVRGGADLLELGVPFSDPMADGPAIQRASERALAAGVTLAGVLEMVAEFRRDDTGTPVVLMGYLNPVEAMGAEQFAGHAAAAGVDGVLLVDMPPEQGNEVLEACIARGLQPILLLSPTTPDERVERICRAARGFIYYVSIKGVTGSGRLQLAQLEPRLAVARRFAQLPLVVGFGVKDAATVAALGALADGVVVGSALIEHIHQAVQQGAPPAAAASAFIGELRSALDKTTAAGVPSAHATGAAAPDHHSRGALPS